MLKQTFREKLKRAHISIKKIDLCLCVTRGKGSFWVLFGDRLSGESMVWEEIREGGGFDSLRGV